MKRDRDPISPAGEIEGLNRRIIELEERIDELVYSETMFQSLFEQAGTYSMVLDPNTEDGIPIILEANRSACEHHGYTRQEFIGRPVSIIDDEEGKEKVRENTRLILTGVPFSVENRHVRKDGSYFDVVVNAQRINIGSNPPLILTTEMDITARKKAEEQLLESRDSLRGYARRLVAVREEERSSLARNLHDELGQVLTMIGMDLDWLRGQVPETDTVVQERLVNIRNLVSRGIEDVRHACTGLRPGILDNLGLIPAIEWLLSDVARRTGLRTEFTHSIAADIPSEEVSTTLFRVSQELVTNVIRHARAASLSIELKADDANFTIAVSDDGTGFDPQQAPSIGSLGLMGIRERVAVHNGELDIVSSPGEGVSVIVRLPKEVSLEDS